jgi:CRP-like cAMP-binding protein
MIHSSTAAQIPYSPVFSHLDGEIVRAVLSLSHVTCLKAGEILLHQGDLIHSFYVIQSGGMRLVNYAEDGQCVALKVYGAGDVFGLLAISGSYPHPTQIESIHDTTLITIDGRDARALMIDFPELALTFIDLLIAHVHEGHDRVRQMATRRVDRRLAQSLLNLADKFGKPVGNHMRIDLAITQRDLAEFTGTTVETISRTLTQWEKQGWLISTHKRLELCDLAALRSVTETP